MSVLSCTGNHTESLIFEYSCCILTSRVLDLSAASALTLTIAHPSEVIVMTPLRASKAVPRRGLNDIVYKESPPAVGITDSSPKK